MAGDFRLALTKGGPLLPPDRIPELKPELESTLGSGDTLWLHSGRWRHTTSLNPAAIAAPFAFWDGAHVISNLPGVGPVRSFHDLKIHFYRSSFAELPPQPSPGTLLVPCYDLGHSHYHDGPVLARLGDQGHGGEVSFALPHGRFRYEGPLSSAEQPADAFAFRRPSLRQLRAPLVAALKEWLYHRYAPSLCEVTIDPQACPRRQACALVYLKMAEFFPGLVIKIPEGLASAKGFKALSRNLGCYVGKAQPFTSPAPHPLDLSRLLFFVSPSRLSETIADFNEPSDLIPSAFQRR